MEECAMKFTAPLSSVTTEPREAIKIIADNLISTRPVTEVAYRPFRNDGVYSTPHDARVDLKKLYPEAKPGNVVYITAILDSSADSDGAIRVHGAFCDYDVAINGEWLEREIDRNGNATFWTHFDKGANTKLTIRAKCTSEEKFELMFLPTTRYFFMWARWYLLNVQVKSPLQAFAGEEGVGISRLYESEAEAYEGDVVYPKAPLPTSDIDFDKIYPGARGKVAYALTYATADTELLIKTESEVKVFVNGSSVECGRLVLAEGDEVLVKLLKGDSWSFSYEGEGIGLPMVETGRGVNDKWLTLGAFSECGDMVCKHGPEYGVQFVKPYRDAGANSVFWMLADKEDYVRPYLQSCFFGQWFYALMVGTHGLLRAGEALKCPEYKDYFVDSTELMARYYDYMCYEKPIFRRVSFIEAATHMGDLDSIGSMGRNLSELYNIKPSSETMHLIDDLAEAARTKIPRFEDGTYHRPRDMWADDMFMSCPFLVRLGNIKHSDYYYEEVIRQFRGFKERLWMADEQIMSHIFFLDTNEPNNIPWGRGNGWVYVSLSDALENIPEGFSGRDFLMDFYHSFTEGLVKLQDADGLWHQVLNRPDSYQETSCTAMFLLGLTRGIKNGWLDRETYMPYVMRAYHGLLNKKISSTGNVYDVCRGSSNSKNVDYYMNLGAIDNDDHGTGVILTAFSELLKII
jgi:rhamnogalacturonyl hydrolase YesR